jgi:hypothetical protein
MRTHATCYDDLRQYIASVPIIDCHDHSWGPGGPYKDPLHVVLNGYFPSDVYSVAGPSLCAQIQDATKPWEERWKLFEPVWKLCRHTGYAQCVRRALKLWYDEDEVTLESLKRIESRLPDYGDDALVDSALERAGIVKRIVDGVPLDWIENAINGKPGLCPRAVFTIGLPFWHDIRCAEDIQQRARMARMAVTNLDEYLAAARKCFEVLKSKGGVTFKDQSAYKRAIDYGNPSKSEAETVFNRIISDHRKALGYPDELRPLDDYLFHQFLRMAREMDLPVQVHTGHMAGNWNDVRKANAALMQPVFELHQEVRFDLFHANWPYSGDVLFLAKNYPNVTINFCWANIIDPIYTQQMMKQSVSCVPHGKIHGYGSDLAPILEHVLAHVEIMRDNVAIALSQLVEEEWFGLDDAKEIAEAWLFSNPNRFFRLGL